MALTSEQVQDVAHACGFEIAGVTSASPHSDFVRFESWSQSGKAGNLRYLTDHRGPMRADPRTILPSAQSIICLGKLYNTDRPLSIENVEPSKGWISRYAWGLDYHDLLRPALEKLTTHLTELYGSPFESRICIDTAPLLERSYARAAGLGWIGKNTCLINENHGSWFFLAELLVSFEIVADTPVPDRCGTCTRCIQACPTDAIVPNSLGDYEIDARLCISYLTIEERGVIHPGSAALHGHHVFGCDICQDVCPWNIRAHLHAVDIANEPGFAARIYAPDLAELSLLTEDEFRALFRHSPIWRTKFEGFLRNVAIAMGNSRQANFREPLLRLTHHHNNVVSTTAIDALARLEILLIPS